MPTQAAANRHHSNRLPACHVANLREEGWKGDESARREGSSLGSQIGAGGGGRGRREEEEETEEINPQEVLSGHQSSLDSTLRHIVQQLDILTQVSYKWKSKPSSHDTGRLWNPPRAS